MKHFLKIEELKDKIEELKKKLDGYENPEMYCPICLETERSANLDIVKLSCTHTIHLKCYIDYISDSSKVTDCPVCRKPYNLPKIADIVQKLKNELNILQETEQHLINQLNIYRRRPIPPPLPPPLPPRINVNNLNNTNQTNNREIPDDQTVNITWSLPGNPDSELFNSVMNNALRSINNGDVSNLSQSLTNILNSVADTVLESDIGITDPRDVDTMRQLQDIIGLLNPQPPNPPRGNNLSNLIPSVTTTPNNTQQNTTRNSPIPVRVNEILSDSDTENNENINVDVEIEDLLED